MAAGAGALVVGVPAPVTRADPPAPAAPTTAEPAPAPDPNVAPPPADPNAPSPDPNNAAPPPDPGRVNNDVGGFSFVVPPGWEEGDASQVPYGSALLRPTAAPGASAPADTCILLGKLDLKLFAGAEPDNTKAAIRLASDMGEFFMPFQGIRINQHTIALNAAGVPGATSYYEVKFNDTTKPDGQIWAAAIGSTSPGVGTQAPRNDRWFVAWLGTANDPIDTDAAIALAESIRPWTPPPPPDANTPPPLDTNAPPPPPGQAPVGVPVPVQDAPPEMMPPG